MRAVAATGYDGYLSLEIFNDQFRGGSPKSISVDGQRSLVYLMDQVRRDEPGARHRRRRRCPTASASTGVEFVEFAADAARREAAGRLLDTLGLRSRRPPSSPRT